MNDAIMSQFPVEAPVCAGMTQPEANHRDREEKYGYPISHPYPTYISVAPKLRHPSSIKGLDAFYHHFCVTAASCAWLPQNCAMRHFNNDQAAFAKRQKRDLLSMHSLKRHSKQPIRPATQNVPNTWQCSNFRRR